MTTRVVILMIHGHAVSTQHSSREAAVAFMEQWKTAAIANNGKLPPDVESRVMEAQDPVDGKLVGVYSCPWILGMYILDDSQKTPHERAVEAVEKMANVAVKHSKEGEEWKGDDE